MEIPRNLYNVFNYLFFYYYFRLSETNKYENSCLPEHENVIIAYTKISLTVAIVIIVAIQGKNICIGLK